MRLRCFSVRLLWMIVIVYWLSSVLRMRKILFVVWLIRSRRKLILFVRCRKVVLRIVKFSNVLIRIRMCWLIIVCVSMRWKFSVSRLRKLCVYCCVLLMLLNVSVVFRKLRSIVWKWSVRRLKMSVNVLSVSRSNSRISNSRISYSSNCSSLLLSKVF